MKAISAPITAIPPKVINRLVCFRLLGNISISLPPSLLSLFLCMQDYNSKEQNKYAMLYRSVLLLSSLLLLLLSHLQECNPILLAAFFGCDDKFNKVSVCAVPVKIIKSMTAAKCKGSSFFIPLHGTAAR